MSASKPVELPEWLGIWRRGKWVASRPSFTRKSNGGRLKKMQRGWQIAVQQLTKCQYYDIFILLKTLSLFHRTWHPLMCTHAIIITTAPVHCVDITYQITDITCIAPAQIKAASLCSSIDGRLHVCGQCRCPTVYIWHQKDDINYGVHQNSAGR